MVFPDTPDAREGKSTRSLRLFGISGALILIASAVFLLGRLTTPSPTVEPEPSTTSTTILTAPTTSSPFPEQGEPFKWLQIWESDNSPLAVHAIDDRTLVFAYGERGRGVEVWSSDPTYWGLTVIDTDHYVQSIIATNFGLLAVGSEVESEAPVVWRSTDGINWDKTALPSDGIDNLHLSYVTAYASNDLITVHGQMRAGENHDSLYRKAESVLKERFGDLLEYFYWEVVGPEVRFNAFGPFGLALGWATAQNLGLDPSEYMNGDDPEVAVIWVSPDGADWSAHVMDFPLYLGETFIGPNGGLWALGQNGFLTTTDGVDWRRIPTTRLVNRPIGWGNTIVAFSWNIGEVVASTDGSNWETIEGPDRLLLRGQGDTPEWYTMAAGPYGLAIVITRRSEDPTTAPPPPPILVKREGTAELWVEDQLLVVRRQGKIVATVEPWTPLTFAGFIDLEAGTMTFRDPATGEVLIVVTAEDLRAATLEELPGWEWEPGSEKRALLFTSDLARWTVQGLGAFDDQQVLGVYVFEDRLVLVTGDSGGYKVLESFRP